MCNFIEIYAHMILLAVLAILIWYAHDAAEDPESISDDLSYLVIIINGHLLGIGLCLMVAMFLKKPVSTEQSQQWHEAWKSFALMSNTELNSFVNTLTEWDQFYFTEASSTIRVEFMGKTDERKRAMVHAPQAHLHDVAPPPPPKGSDGNDANKKLDASSSGGTSLEPAEEPIPQEAHLLPIFDEVPPDSHITPRSSPRWNGVSTPRITSMTPPVTPRTPLTSPRF